MNCFKKWNVLLGLLFSAFPHVFAQNTSLLTPERALEVALLNHFDIFMAKTQVKQAELSNNLGNAGIAPQIEAIAGYGGSNRDLRQLFVSGNEVNQNNVATSEFNYALSLSWTLFDGFSMYARRKALGEQVLIKEWELKSKIQELTVQVLGLYYLICADKVMLRSLESLKAVVSKRLEFASSKLEKGTGNKQDWLVAKIELQRVMGEISELQNKINGNKITLLSWMGETHLHSSFDVLDSFEINSNLLNQFSSNTSQSPEKQLAQSKLLLSDWMLKNAQGARMPHVSFGTAYTGIRAESEAGFLLQNRNNGFNYGITARMPLFSGGQLNAQLKQAKLESEGLRNQVKFIGLRIDAEELKAFETLKTYFNMVSNEQENIKWATELIQIQGDRYSSGLATTIETKEAERMFEESNYRLARFLYLAKMAELDLLRSRGGLIK